MHDHLRNQAGRVCARYVWPRPRSRGTSSINAFFSPSSIVLLDWDPPHHSFLPLLWAVPPAWPGVCWLCFSDLPLRCGCWEVNAPRHAFVRPLGCAGANCHFGWNRNSFLTMYITTRTGTAPLGGVTWKGFGGGIAASARLF